MAETILALDRLNKRFGRTVAAQDVSLTIRPGEFFTLLGPSGSGKSSVLRMIAGLESPDSGRIVIAGQDMTGIPPWRRNLGMVFQNYAVFPNLNVAENVGYGLRVRKLNKTVIEHKVDVLLELVGLSGMARRSVVTLSGGEQQRVALARSLAIEPELLLLDEPLSALDEKIRREMQDELKRIQRKTGTTFIYVTHDQEEALTMSDRIAVLNHGVCVQCDAPERLFRRPRTVFVARFFRGCNVLSAECLGFSDGRARLRFAGCEIDVAAASAAIGPTSVAIRAESPRLGAAATACDLSFETVAVDIVYRGTNFDHFLETPEGQRIMVTSTRREIGRTPTQVVCGVSADDIVVLEDDRSLANDVMAT